MTAGTVSSTDTLKTAAVSIDGPRPIEAANPPKMPPLLLTRKDAGNVLGVCESTVTGMIARGILPHVRFGGLVRVPADELERWMREATTVD